MVHIDPAFAAMIIAYAYAITFVAIPVLAIANLLRASGSFKERSVLILIWLFPLLLLINPIGLIRADYIAHAGQISVLAQQIKDGILFPHVSTTVQLIGDQTASVSGRLYYIVASYLSVLFGPNIAIRLLILLVTAVQVATLWFCFKRYLKNHITMYVPLCLTAIAYWTTYAMNNLYVRGGIAEFLATNLLVATVALLMLLWHPDCKKKTSISMGLILCYGATVLTHPPTGVWGAMMLTFVALGLWIGFGFKSIPIKQVPLIFLGILIICAPWLYLLKLYPPSHSAMAYSFHLTRFAGLDIAWLRALPYPLSLMPAEIGHPVFVTQVNTVLFILSLITIVYFFRRHAVNRRTLVAIIFLCFSAFLFSVSVSDYLDAYMPLFLEASQFAYRMVTHINLFMIAAMVLLLIDIKDKKMPTYVIYTGLLATLIAAIGVGANLIQMSPGITYEGKHWWSVTSFKPEWNNYPFLKIFPKSEEVYHYDLSMGCLYAQLPPVTDVTTNFCHTDTVDLHLLPEHGIVSNLIIPPRNSKHDAWMSTNVVYHPWNQLTLNGEPVESRPFQWFYAIKVPPSGGILSYKTGLEPLYLALDRVSLGVFIGLLILLGHARKRFYHKTKGTLQVV